MKRNPKLIGTLAVLVLICIASVPVMAVHGIVGNIYWNDTSVDVDTSVTYNWKNSGEPVAYFIAVVNPDGDEVDNTTHYANGGNGVETVALNMAGTWRVSIGNTTTTNQTYDDLDVGATGWYNIGETIGGIIGFLPSLLSLVVSVVPFIIVASLVSFIALFFDKILAMLKL